MNNYLEVIKRCDHDIDAYVQNFFDHPEQYSNQYENLKGFLMCLEILHLVDLDYSVNVLRRYRSLNNEIESTTID